MIGQLRIARPVTNLARTAEMYRSGLGLEFLGQFEAHDGFDGIMLGLPDCPYHFEFTYCQTHPVPPSPTPEDLVVLYIPDASEWIQTCQQMSNAGFIIVPSLNPYWEVHGRTFADPDGYRVVIQNAIWN